MPDAIVYHAVEPERLNAAYFRALHESRGRSRIYYKDRTGARRSRSRSASCPTSASPALGVATTALGSGGESRRRALARWYHYRAMLAAGRAPRLRRRPALERRAGVPRLERAALRACRADGA